MKKTSYGFGLFHVLAIFALVAILMALPSPAFAQQYKVSTLDTGTNVIAASGTLSPTNAKVVVTKNANVAYSVSFNLSGTGVGNVVSSWAKSIDGTNYESTPSVTMTNVANGTNTVVGVGNTAMGAGGWLKLVSVVNANTPSTVTNLTVKAATKPAN